MPNLPISQLSASSALDGTELLVNVQGGVTKKQTVQDTLNANLPITSSGIRVSGDILPAISPNVSLGSFELPFKELFLQSGSIHIESIQSGELTVDIVNNLGNLDISSGGMRLIEPGNSFIAETGSFQYISGSMTQVGDYLRIGDTITTGSTDLSGSFTASLQEGYVWLGDSNNRSIETPFASLLNSSGSNTDDLGGTAVRTLYTRTNTIAHTDSVNTDFLSGSSEAFGSRDIPSSFLSNTNFKSKTLHFRVFGAFTSNNTDCDIYLQIGNDILTHSNIGATLSQPDGHPFEILGEVYFTDGDARVCYSMGHCGNNGDYKRYPLSDATQLQDVTSFGGGDFKLIISGSGDIDLTSYGGYLQIYN